MTLKMVNNIIDNMEHKEKELLLKDLCARLPYGVICRTIKKYSSDNDFIDKEPIKGVLIDICYYVEELILKALPLTDGYNYNFSVEEIIPYLRPLSSMTVEEKKEYKHLVAFSGSPNGAANFVDWLNKNMFDYRQLIEKGLALEAPKDMYKLKEK